MSEKEQTLTEALADLGIRHEAHDGVRRRLYRGDEHIGNYTSTEGWALVRELQATKPAT